MNPLTIESALRTAFQPSFSGTTIYLGSDYEEMTPESLNLILAAADIEHSAGPLYKATVTVKIVAPALLGSDSLSTFTDTLNSVRSCLESNYLTTNWPSGSPSFAGVWIVNTKTSRENHDWVAEVQATVGVSE